jgi:uncharacterized protein YjbI with pentapeptide repeats
MMGADLRAADLYGADLTGTNLNNVKYDRETRWSKGFDPDAVGAKLVS